MLSAMLTKKVCQLIREREKDYTAKHTHQQDEAEDRCKTAILGFKLVFSVFQRTKTRTAFCEER